MVTEPRELADEAAAILRLQAEVEALKGRVLALEGRPDGEAVPKPDAMYTPVQARVFLRWSRQTIYRKIAAGVLPAVRLPNSSRQLVAGRDIIALIARLPEAL